MTARRSLSRESMAEKEFKSEVPSLEAAVFWNDLFRGMTAEKRRSNYRCDITYTNNSELGFDYLRDNLAGSGGELVMRWSCILLGWSKPFHFAIVDEVDSVLIDEGRNPLLISGEASKDAARYPVAAKVAELLIRGICSVALCKDYLR